jgi:exonuclease SbcC
VISKLHIRHFQCLDDLEVDLDPRITVFVGQSDTGKSSCIRALRWLVLNRPGGTAFITNGDDVSASVTALVDGRRVTRRRSTSANVYRLDTARYVSFGAGKVPEPIANLLNVAEVNFQGQHSPYFWFSDSPQQVSKSLNAIINLGQIDRSLASVAAELRKAKTRRDVCQERLEQARKDKKELAWVVDFDSDLQRLERQQASIKQLHKRRNRLAELIETIKQAQSDAGRPVPNMQRLQQQHEQLTSLKERAGRLRSIIDQIQSAKDQLCLKQETLAKTKSQRHLVVEPKTCPTCGQPLPSSQPISTSLPSLR